MKKLYLILPIMIFVLSCSNNPRNGVSLNISMHNLDGSGSRNFESSDILSIEKVEVWVLSDGAPKPLMNPSKEFLKTPSKAEYTGDQLPQSGIELEVDAGSVVNIWLRVDTVSSINKTYLGFKKLFVSPNAELVKVDVYETDLSLLNSSAEEWNEFIKTNY